MARMTAPSTAAEAPTTTTPRIPDDTTFGARLALIRQMMGWGNIAEAARACGIDRQSWRLWEQSSREPRHLITICVTIATRANVDLDWLVYGRVKPGAEHNGRYPNDVADMLKPRIPAALQARVVAGPTVMHGDGRRRRQMFGGPVSTGAPIPDRSAGHKGRPVSLVALA